MAATHWKDNDLKRVIRGLALALGFLANVPFMLFLFERGSEAWTQLSWSNPQGKLLFAALALALVGYALAWRWLRIGGVLAVACAVTLCALVFLGSGTNLLPAALLIGIPLFVSGLLFLACGGRALKAQS